MYFKAFCVLFCIFCIRISGQSSSSSYARARIESCPGCQLNRLQEVKKFIYEDVPHYENVEFKKIQGAPPELVLLDENDEEVDRIALNSFSRKECNELLRNKGFVSVKDIADRKEL